MRKEEERKKALDARLRFEQERMEQERLEQEERERRYREREEQIEEHRHGGGIWGGFGVVVWALGPDGDGDGDGWRWQRSAPLPCPLGRRKQQSMEAEEARQRLKEQSIFVSAPVGTGMGALGVAVPEVAVTGAFCHRGSSKRRTTGSSCGNRSRRWR